MALPTITKMQKTAQEMLNKNKEQLAASTSATQSGSTNTPTTTSTPKVTSTPKAQPSVAQPTVTQQTVSTPTQPVDLTKINLFKPQETVKTIQQAAPNLLSKKTETQDVQNTTIPTNTVRAALQMGGSALKAVADTIYNQGLDYAKQMVGTARMNATAFGEGLSLFSKAYQDTAGNIASQMYSDISSDIKQERESGEGVGIIRDAFANTFEGVPRGIVRAEYGMADLLDWAVDAQWATNLKNNIEKDLEYWENTRVQQRAKEAEGFKDFMKNPLMYAGGTLGEMLPMFISAWVAIPTTFAQVYGETYRDYSTDQSLIDAGLTDNQIRLMSLGVGAVNTLIELGSDLVEGIMPWTKPGAKGLEKTVRTRLSKPFMNIFKNVVKGGLSEGIEEVLQNEIQEQVAVAAGSDRDLPTRAERLTTFGISAVIGGLLQGGNIMVEIEGHKELEKAFEEWSEAVDDFAPGVSEEDKKKFFSAIVAAEIQDQQMSDRQVSKYQQESEQLYNQKAQLEEQLKTATDENVKQSITNQINNIDARITQIDERLNQWQNVMEDVNKQLEEISRKSELPSQQQTPQQQGGENLSEQTMGVITPTRESEDITIVPKNFQQKSLPRKPQALINLANKIVNTSDAKSNSFLSQYDSSSLKSLRNIMVQIEQGGGISSFNAYKARNVIDKIDAAMQYISNVQSSVSAPTDEEIANMAFDDLWEKYEGYYNSIGMSKDNAARIWTIEHGDPEVSQHLIGLTNSEIKKMSKDLTKKEIMEINEAFAKASSYLGIDFNLVVGKNKFGISFTNDMLFDDEGLRGKATQLLDAMAVMVTNKNGIEETQSTVGHELSHIVDFAYKDVSGHYILANNKGSVLAKWDSYKWTKEAKEKGYSQSDKVSKYRRRPTEIWARFNQQYIAYQDYLKGNTEMYEKMANSPMYNEDGTVNDYSKFWDNDTFLSLLPEYQDIYNNKIYSYKSAEGNENFYAVMKKLNGFRSSRQIIEDDTYNMTDKEFLEDISERNPEATDELKNKILNMRDIYQQLKDMVDGLKGTISNEIKKEYEVALSLMQSNLDLITSLGEEYLNMEKNTKEQQKQFDKGVNTISDNGQELISEVENNQQDGEIVDDATKEEIEENKEPDTTGPLDTAVTKVVDKVINSSNKVIDKNVKEKTVKEQQEANEKKNSIREVGQGIKDVFTPALSRLYGISPRLAGAVHVYEASVGLKTLGYKRLSENFVKELDKLKKKNPEAYKKLSLALFDWGMDESIDIKQSLKDAGLDEKLFEPVVSVLNKIATDYQSAGLDITINDKYFPRKVKDYGLLLDYLSRKSGTNIKDTRGTILKQIDDINNDPNLSDGEKERQVHNLLINNFTKPSERSNNAKERKLVLSEWLLTDEERKQGYVNDITDFYEDPIVSLSNYIDDMVKKTELKKMLGGLTNDKTAISEKFDDSIAKIILDMEARGELTPEKAEEAKKVIKSIVNARATGKGAQRIKNLTYSMTIANWLSAAQQLEDLSKTLLRGPSGLKNIVKSVVGKANIGMDDTGIDNIFAELEGGKNITDLLFKLSGFDAVDSLGKKSFLNTARDSCVKQANNEKKSIILKTRLIEMYGEEMGNSIFDSYKNGELRDENKQLKLDVMVDLMYQLGNTQPIYRSAMPTAYLNNPKIRVMYCLWSFTLKQVDRVIQGTKEVYNNQRLLGKSKAIARTAATLRCTGALTVVSIISALVQEFINFGKGDEDDLMFKKLREEGFGAFLKQFGINSLSGLLKIFNISKYDQYIFDREGLDAVFINKITPAWLNIPGDIIQVLVGKDKVSEIGKYTPLFLKPLYYQFKNRGMLPDYKLWGGEDKSKKGGEERDWGDNEEWNWGDGEEWNRGEEEEWNWD